MNKGSEGVDVFERKNLESFLAALLGWGTIGASAIIACGMIVSFSSSGSILSARLINIGIVLSSLPVVRVAVMTISFVKQLDFVFALIGFLVLLIIAMSAAFNMSLH